MCCPIGLVVFSARSTRLMYSMGQRSACSADIFRCFPHLSPALCSPQLKSSNRQFILSLLRSLHRVVVPERCMLNITYDKWHGAWVATRGVKAFDRALHWAQLRHLHQSHFWAVHHAPQPAMPESPQRNGVHGAPTGSRSLTAALRWPTVARREWLAYRIAELRVAAGCLGGTKRAWPWLAMERSALLASAGASRAVDMPQLSTPLAPPPTNRLDTGLPFVYMAGSGASQRRPVIICLVEKGVRPTAQLSLAARAHTRCARGRALRCGVLLSSRDSEFRDILTRMAPSAGLAMDFHSHTRSRCPAGTAGPSAYRTP